MDKVRTVYRFSSACENFQKEMEAYIKFFNKERPAYSLGIREENMDK